MDNRDVERENKPPDTFLMKRGKDPDRRWTQEILLRYSKDKGIKFQEVVWQILFTAASRMDLNKTHSAALTNGLEKVNESLRDDKVDLDKRYELLRDFYIKHHFKKGTKNKILTETTETILKQISDNPYTDATKIAEDTNYRQNAIHGIFRELKKYGIILPKGPRCPARLRHGGYCKNYTKPGVKFCRMHKNKEHAQRHLIEDDVFNLKAQQYWDEALKLEKMDEVPTATINDIFYHVKDSFENYDGKIVAIRRLRKWYRNTQSGEHPVWIINHNYPHLTARPYREILNDKHLKEGDVTKREKVTQYLQENPGSFCMEVHDATGVKKQDIYDIANEDNLKLGKLRKSR